MVLHVAGTFIYGQSINPDKRVLGKMHREWIMKKEKG